MVPILFEDRPNEGFERAFLDIFSRLTTPTSFRAVWESIVRETPNIPNPRRGLRILQAGSKYFQQFPIDFGTIEVFDQLTFPFLSLEFLKDPFSAICFKIAMKSYFPLVILYTLKNKAVDTVIRSNETMPKYIKILQTLTNAFVFIKNHLSITRELIQVLKSASQLVYSILESNGIDIYGDTWREMSGWIWSCHSKAFQWFWRERRSTTSCNWFRKQLATILRPCAVFCGNGPGDVLCNRESLVAWAKSVSGFCCLLEPERDDFFNNPPVYWSMAFEVDKAFVRGCALIMARNIAAALPDESLLELLPVLRTREHDIRIVAHCAKVYVGRGEAVQTVLAQWILYICQLHLMRDDPNPFVVSGVFFLLAKAMELVRKLPGVERIVNLARDGLHSPFPVVATNAAKLMRSLMSHRVCRESLDLSMPWPDLVFWGLSADPMRVVTQCAIENTVLFEELGEVAAAALHVVNRELNYYADGDFIDSPGKQRMIDAGFSFLGEFVRRIGDFAFCDDIYDIVHKTFGIETVDGSGAMRLAFECIDRDSPKSDAYLSLFLVFLRSSATFMGFLNGMTRFFLRFVDRIAVNGLGLFVSLLKDREGTEMRHRFILITLIVQILIGGFRIAEEIDFNDLIIGLITGDHPLGQLCGWNLVAACFLAGIGEVGEEMAMGWINFIGRTMLYSERDLRMHIAALERLGRGAGESVAAAFSEVVKAYECNPESFLMDRDWVEEYIDAELLDEIEEWCP
jgi:hypothetical protein